MCGKLRSKLTIRQTLAHLPFCPEAWAVDSLLGPRLCRCRELALSPAPAGEQRRPHSRRPDTLLSDLDPRNPHNERKIIQDNLIKFGSLSNFVHLCHYSLKVFSKYSRYRRLCPVPPLPRTSETPLHPAHSLFLSSHGAFRPVPVKISG